MTDTQETSCYENLSEEAQKAIDTMVYGSFDLIAASLQRSVGMCNTCVFRQLTVGLLHKAAMMDLSPDVALGIIDAVLNERIGVADDEIQH